MAERLLGKSQAELISLLQDNGMPAFVGKQVADWIYRKNVLAIDSMTNVSKRVREWLAAHYDLGIVAPIDEQRSVDGTVKYLFPVECGGFVETVYIPDGDRATLCVSSQVGCKMGCKFCMTGRQGFHGQLTVGDILNQIYALPQGAAALTNVVFMGQGEPMDNYASVLKATQILTAPWGLAWSPKRITVSTVGVESGLRRFLTESDCHVAVSLHNPFPAERVLLMPVERAYPITKIVNLLAGFPAFARRRGANECESRQRRISFEYTLFEGYNDSERHACGLLDLLRPLDCRVNLIRFHEIPDSNLRPVSEDKMVWFRNYLTQHGLFATIRASRGQDIYAACGLLTTKKNDEQAEAFAYRDRVEK